MKLTYDPRYNIAYIYFKEKKTEVESIKISDEVIIDIDTDGSIYGIELLNANKQLLQNGDRGKVLFENEATGEKKELSILPSKIYS
ncbi:MAG: DUF2283 domain-containing protein [Cytophagales bacterium]|nr:DUF2283 domain-containing protein [Cytophagales bacterium]